MSKIYFIVGAMGTGTTIISGEIVDSYRKNTQVAVIKTLGIPEKLKVAGTRPAAETLDKIETAIAAESSADAIIFRGWRIPDHINEIYDSYPLATYIFTSAASDLHLDQYLKAYVSEEEQAGIRTMQQSNIDSFVLANSLTLTWNKVADAAFDASRNLNLSETGTISVAVHGTL